MHLAFRVTKKRIVAFVLLALIPLAFIVVGLFSHFMVGQLFSVWSVVVWFFLPLAALSMLAFLLFADLRIRAFIRTILVVLLLLAFVFIDCNLAFFMPYELFQRYENEDALALEGYYVTETEGFPHMPVLTSLGEAENVVFCSHYQSFAIFDSYSCILIVQYTPTVYEREKETLEERFVFHEGPIGTYKSCKTSDAEIDGYFFRALTVDGEYSHIYNYPHKMMFIGVNDTTHEIVYMTFEDGDLDYIDDLSQFILDDCGWKYVK